jgi:hypothetical protein
LTDFEDAKATLRRTEGALDATGTEDHANDENVDDDSYSHGHDRHDH